MSILRRISLVALMVIVLSPPWPSRGSTAFLNNAVSSSGNTLTAGSINLAKQSPAGALFNVSGLYPGQSTSKIDLTLQNSGTVSLQYTMSTTVNSDAGGLAPIVQLTIWTSTCAASTGPTTTALNSAAISSARTIAASGTDALCFQASLPSTAASSLQNQSATVTFTFAATQ